MVCVDALLEDNFVKLEMRDRLSGTTLNVGAQGGYHTNNSKFKTGLSAREKLKSFNIQRGDFLRKSWTW